MGLFGFLGGFVFGGGHGSHGTGLHELREPLVALVLGQVRVVRGCRRVVIFEPRLRLEFGFELFAEPVEVCQYLVLLRDVVVAEVEERVEPGGESDGCRFFEGAAVDQFLDVVFAVADRAGIVLIQRFQIPDDRLEDRLLDEGIGESGLQFHDRSS